MDQLLWLQSSIGAVRKEKLHGKEHLVAPVIMVQEGVLKGVFASEEELSTHVRGWDGMPVTLGHPQVRGEDVSARDPEIMDEWSTGMIFNTHWDEATKQLKAEVWIESERLAAMGEAGAAALAAIEAGDPLDVSTGFFAPATPQLGTYKGETYQAAFSSIRPDHLALLPGQRGECSWEDGCGVRANKHDDDNKNRSDSMDKKKLVEALITNEKTDFTKEDEESLLSMDEGLLQKFAKRAGCECQDVNTNDDSSDDDSTDESGDDQTNDDQTNEDDKTVTLSADDVKKMVADGVKEALEANDPERKSLLAALKADETIALSDDDIDGLTNKQLRAFASATGIDVDYSGRGLFAPVNTNSDDAPVAPAPVLLAVHESKSE